MFTNFNIPFNFRNVVQRQIWGEVVHAVPAFSAVHLRMRQWKNDYKKLSYCWETVRRESMPRIAKMDVEMTT